MSKPFKTSWRGFALSAAVGLGALAVAPAEAGRVITSSDSGGLPGIPATAKPTLTNCSDNRFGRPSFRAESCLGTNNYSFDPLAGLGSVANLVNSRWSDWTSVDRSANVKSNFTVDKIFFNAALAGDLVLVLSGTWANPIANGSVGWSSYFLFEDVEISPQIGDVGFTGLRYDVEGTDSGGRFSTTGLVVTGISLYQIERVPEPGTLALVVLALGGLALVAKRRSR